MALRGPAAARAGVRAVVCTAVCAVAFALQPGGRVFAADGPEAREPGTDEPGLFSRMGRSIDDTQRRASEGFTGFVTSVDGFFGDDTDSAVSNDSWARIRVEAARPGGEDLEFDATVKLRVVLPQSEQRFRILFSSEDEEASVVNEEGAIRPPRARTADDQNASLALRFIRTARDTSSVSFDLGVRQREGLVQVFGRLKAVVEGEMVRRWTGRASNNFFYYAKSGYENRLNLDVSRPISRRGNVFFRTSTAFNWRRGRKGASINETIGFYADFGESTVVAFEALGGYSTSIIEGRPRYSGAEVRIRFRQSAWRPWFFYEVWPSVAWPASTDYERVWGWLLRAEIVLGQQRS